VTLLFNLNTCFNILKDTFINVKLSCKLPQQLIVRFKGCTLLLFNSGQFRIMGKVSIESAFIHLESIHYIYSDIIIPLHLVSQTVVSQFDISLCPINLHHISQIYKHDKNVRFECELFPALSLHFWSPIHVNVFSNGKVIILGKDSLKFSSNIIDWLFNALLLLPVL